MLKQSHVSFSKDHLWLSLDGCRIERYHVQMKEPESTLQTTAWTNPLTMSEHYEGEYHTLQYVLRRCDGRWVRFGPYNRLHLAFEGSEPSCPSRQIEGEQKFPLTTQLIEIHLMEAT